MTGVLAEGTVLGEVRSDTDDFATGVAQSLQHAHQSRCSTAGQENMLHTDGGIGTHSQVGCHSATGIGIAGSGGIAVDLQGVSTVGHFLECLHNTLGCGNRRIADGIVIDIFLAYYLCPLQAKHKQFADAGLLAAQLIHRFVNHTL